MQSVTLHAGRVLFQSSGRTPSGFLQKCKKMKISMKKEKKCERSEHFFSFFIKIFIFLHFRKNPLVASAGGPRLKKHPPRMQCDRLHRISHKLLFFLSFSFIIFSGLNPIAQGRRTGRSDGELAGQDGPRKK